MNYIGGALRSPDNPDIPDIIYESIIAERDKNSEDPKNQSAESPKMSSIFSDLLKFVKGTNYSSAKKY